jgi:thiol-disulfide isomerase/thioredoxin
MSKSNIVFAVCLVVLMGALGWAGARYGRRAEAPAESAATLHLLSNPVSVGHFSARDLDGREISLESLRGKVTIVNFWATWCPPCRAEIPDLIALQEKYKNDLQIIGVSQDDESVEVVKRFVDEYRINYPIVMSTPELERVFTGIYALPTSFIIDRDGRIAQKHVGLLNAATTELETRALAGLEINARIEYVEADEGNRKLIKEAAQATQIPGLDLDALTPAARTAVLKQLNTDTCTCGCGLTLAACRINDPGCQISLPIAQRIVETAAAARP